MWPTVSGLKGTLERREPRVRLLLPSVRSRDEPEPDRDLPLLGISLSVNAHSSAQNQAAAQTFVDFIARPKQNALWGQVGGGLTQYEFLKGQIPAWEVRLRHCVQAARVRRQPAVWTWWNANVLLALNQDGVRLVHRSGDDRRRPERDGRCLEGRTVVRAVAERGRPRPRRRTPRSPSCEARGPRHRRASAGRGKRRAAAVAEARRLRVLGTAGDASRHPASLPDPQVDGQPDNNVPSPHPMGRGHPGRLSRGGAALAALALVRGWARPKARRRRAPTRSRSRCWRRPRPSRRTRS